MSQLQHINVVSFENRLGQTIQPGDAVITVTSGLYGDPDIRKGIYKGLNANGKVKVDYIAGYGENKYWRRTTLQLGRVYKFVE